jgi:hypothetical protein
MSTTHTPGPWEAIGNKICTVGTDRERETIATSNEKAFSDAPNARLMASAPDMLHALEQARAQLHEVSDMNNAANWLENSMATIEYLNQVIAKAKGA